MAAAFAKEASAHFVIDWQVGPAKQVISNTREISAELTTRIVDTEHEPAPDKIDGWELKC